MAAQRRSRSWWRQAIARWKRSGLSAREFASREGIKEGTLRWWTTALRRDTRAARGSSKTAMAIAPIEIAVPATASRSARHVEIAVAGAVVRVEVGTDVEYVGAVVDRIGAARGC